MNPNSWFYFKIMTCSAAHICYCVNCDLKLTDSASIFGKTWADVRRKDEKRLKLLRTKYTVVVIWTCLFKQIVKEDPEIQDWLNRFSFCSNFPLTQTFSEEEIIQHIVNKKIKGTLQCDLYFPLESRDRISEYSPLFFHKIINLDDHVSEPLQSYCKYYGYLSTPQKLLVSGYEVKQQFLTTNYLLYLISKGCQVSNVTLVMEADTTDAFKDYIEGATMESN